VGHVFANEASPLQVRRLRHTLQDYLSQRGAMPEVREGVGERAEPAESAAEISAVDGGTAGRLTVNAAVSVRGREFGNRGGRR
jgi:predicted fused transcriptional regulator/phosphomethylpyrimidine kinase